MQVISLIWGVVPFSFVGLVVSIVAIATARGSKGMAVAGATLCLVAILLGALFRMGGEL